MQTNFGIYFNEKRNSNILHIKYDKIIKYVIM